GEAYGMMLRELEDVLTDGDARSLHRDGGHHDHHRRVVAVGVAVVLAEGDLVKADAVHLGNVLQRLLVVLRPRFEPLLGRRVAEIVEQSYFHGWPPCAPNASISPAPLSAYEAYP